MVNNMNENLELLMYIYKTCDMGVYSTNSLIKNLKNKDNKITYLLENEVKEYEHFLNISKKLLTNSEVTPKGSGFMTKMSSDMGIRMETMKDNSDGAIASMMCEGIMMGVVEMKNKISKYKRVSDKKVIKLANQVLKFQEEELEKLKTFI